MDGVALIEQAREAGLELWLVDGTLKMKGQKRLASLARLISQNKEEVVGALQTQTNPSPNALHCDEKNTCDSAETLGTPANVEVSSHESSVEPHVGKPERLARRRIGTAFPPRITPPPPVAIHATPIEICPRCNRGRVQPELREITGGKCWSCWELEMGISQMVQRSRDDHVS
jgi:dsDNA-binding SOS-regulon protein